ncbi:MAG: phytanoyl-CoA dioxygenase family protein [Gammaproteobacteria bacterium]|nr:phytanoyl-CoA dioxygenase family protein [Gammaproteobacteria bacterium]
MDGSDEMLTEAQIAQYAKDGYVLVRDVLEPETLSELRAVTDAVVAGASGLTEHTDILDLEMSHRPDAPRVRRIKRPHLAHPFYRELAAHAGIMNALTPLIGENIRLRPGGKVNMKAADYGAPVEWHQDWAFYPHTNQDVLAVGILLDDMDEDNGPLLVVPGSHRGPVYDHHSEGVFCGAIDLTRTPLDVSGARKLSASAGSITIHHARLVHGSERNTSGRQRRILFYEFAAADAWPLAGVENISSLEDFDARIVHGVPTLEPRVETVPVRMPLPVAVHQGSIYENQRTIGSRYFETAD